LESRGEVYEYHAYPHRVCHDVSHVQRRERDIVLSVPTSRESSRPAANGDRKYEHLAHRHAGHGGGKLPQGGWIRGDAGRSAYRVNHCESANEASHRVVPS